MRDKAKKALLAQVLAAGRIMSAESPEGLMLRVELSDNETPLKEVDSLMSVEDPDIYAFILTSPDPKEIKAYANWIEFSLNYFAEEAKKKKANDEKLHTWP